MTTKPREFWISMCTFNDGYTEIYETRTAEFEPCPPAEKIHVAEAAPLLAKIARLERLEKIQVECKIELINDKRKLEAALQKCKEQRDSKSFSPFQSVNDNFELYSILQPEQDGNDNDRL